MEDRFRYRVWDKTKNKWLYFDFSTYPTYQDRIWQALTDGKTFYQCTGLKDKNGKLIYEGDVVTYDWLTPIGKVWRTDGKHIVEWHDGFTVIGNIAGYDIEHGKTRNVKVIGNIYENPELLED